MKRAPEDNSNPDLVKSGEERFLVQPLSAQQQPKTPTQTPPTGTTPTTTSAPQQKALVEPVPPVFVRRILTAKLDSALNPKVTQIVTDREKVMVGNYKLVLFAEKTLRQTALPAPAKEANRNVAVQVYKTLKRVRDERNKELTGAVHPPNKRGTGLTTNGKSQNVTMAFKEITSDTNKRLLVEVYGCRKGKASTKPGDVLAINPGFKVGNQTLQLLGHLSQVFFNRVEDMEVQAMLVNDRILVAANDQKAIASFKGQRLRDLLAADAKNRVSDIEPKAKVRPYKIGALCEALKLDLNSIANLTPVQEDGAKILAEYALGHHIDHAARAPLRSVINVLKYQAVEGPPMLGPFVPTAAHHYLTDPKYKHQVILVQTPVLTGWHAEQALAYTMILAKWRKGAFVAGTKLPCFGCWLTLNLLPQRGYPLTFTQKPGYIWDTTIAVGMTVVGNALGIATTADLRTLCGNAKVHTDNRFVQFMTALSALDDLKVNVVKGAMPKSVTQSLSQYSCYIAKEVPVPTSIAGGSYPDNPPYSPPGTYNSPPSSPGYQEDLVVQADYDKKVKEHNEAKAKKEQEEKEAAAKKDAGGTTTTKKDADGTTTIK